MTTSNSWQDPQWWGDAYTDQETSGMITSVADIGAVGVHGNMYEAWAFPDLHPEEPQPVLGNWHEEDLVAFCGGEYAKKAYANNQ